MAVALFLLVCGLTMEFFPETLALLWHIRHGRTATLSNNAGKFEIPVPTWWFARHISDPSSLMLMTGSGRFRGVYLQGAKWGSAVFSGTRWSLSEAEKQKIMSKLDAQHQKNFSQSNAEMDARMDDLFGPSKSISKLSIAGQRSECFERVSLRFTNLVLVDCEPEAPTQGLSVLFSGHPSSVPEFLELLRLVRKKS